MKIKISNDITLLGKIIVVIVYTFFAKGMFPYSKASAEMMDYFKVCLRKTEKRFCFLLVGLSAFCAKRSK